MDVSLERIATLTGIIENVQEHESDWVWDGIVIEDAHMDLY